MLEGGVADPQSPANSLPDKRYANFVAAFDFVAHGAATTGRDAVQNAPKQFVLNTGLAVVRPGVEFVKAETDYYKANIGKVKSIDDLLRDQRLLRIAMSAYGLNADAETPKQIRTMLAGGVSDPNSPANKLTDKSYAAFVTAFNFVEHGAATTDARRGPEGHAQALHDEDGDRPGRVEQILHRRRDQLLPRPRSSDIQSIDDLMADKRLLNYRACPPMGSIRRRSRRTPSVQMLEGGVSDPKSPANKLDRQALCRLRHRFQLLPNTAKTATTYNRAQQPSIDKYLRQTLEENAGKQNEGVRLALYFERKAADPHQLLRDPRRSRRWPRWCAPRSACPTPSPPPTSTAR